MELGRSWQMARVLILGDINIGKYILNYLRKNNDTVLGIQLIVDRTDVISHSLWESVDYDNFHELTIKSLEFKPEVIVYISPYLHFQKCELNSEIAYILNDEIILHLKESMITSPHLVFISSDLVFGNSIETFNKPDDKLNPYGVLGETISSGETNLDGYGKSTIIRPGIIVRKDKHGDIDTTKNMQYLEMNDLASNIYRIIDDKIYGIYHLYSNDIDPKNYVITSLYNDIAVRPYSMLTKSGI